MNYGPRIAADPLAGLDDDLALHREFVEPRSPAYAAMLDLLRPRIDGEFGERLRDAWRDREFGPFFERPLLLLTAFRDDALREGEEHPLWAGLVAREPDVASITGDRLDDAATPDREYLWASLASRYVQTNDPSRAVAWMWPAALAEATVPGRELDLIDFGASAGLNLVADRLPWVWHDGDGAPLTPDRLPAIGSRQGFDLRPLDLRDAADARWLEALIWPGQRDRLERFEQGLAAFRQLAADGPLVKGASVDDVAAGLPRRDEGEPRAFAYQSIMHDYLPDDVRERYEAALGDWLAESDPGSAIWIEFEIAEGAEDAESAVAITAHLRDGDRIESLALARCGPHPRVLRVDREAVGRFTALLGL